MQHSILEYFNGMDSICREERQYALFLYHFLLNKVGKIYADVILSEISELQGATILQVAYEATYMRDFFYKILNNKLIVCYTINVFLLRRKKWIGIKFGAQ